MKTINSQLVASLFPRRAAASNKGSFGRVLVVACSSTMTGAGVLCAKSILKAGAGWVALALPQGVQTTAACQLPEALTLPLAQTQQGVIDMQAIPTLNHFIRKYQIDLVVIGPGLGEAEFVIPFLKTCSLPVVLDADALNQLAAQNALKTVFPRQSASICTPHPGEMKRLLEQEISADTDTRARQVAQLSAISGSVCLLKGAGTLVAWGEKIVQNTTGGAELAKAGTGDILCGLIAGFWAQLGKANGFNHQTAFDAAVCAVYLHGLCGNLAAKDLTSTCVLAGELLHYLPAAIKQTLQGSEGDLNHDKPN